ncbi:MAG: methyltransferase family protein [Planctomycetota bacterium]
MSLPELRQPLAAGLLVGALAARHLAQLWLTRKKIAGARSGWVTTALLFLCYTGAMGLAVARVASGAAPAAAVLAGSALWLAAVAFRMWALAHLAEQFSSLIEIRSGHRLVDTGPYSLVRHPLHLAFGLEVDALAAVAFSVWAAAPAALVWVVIAVRNRTEEAALRAHFGSAYGEYAGRVPAMNVLIGLARRCRRGSGANA